jgi:transposase, IS5 family
MVFTGFEPSDGSFPNATTICRLRYRLVTAKLEGKGLKVAGSRGAIIDATIIESAARPSQHIEVDDDGQAGVVDSADEQARWVKKGKDACFGYRGYSAVETEDSYVEHVEVHPVNQAEVNKLPAIVDARIDQGITPSDVLADKGYASAANREYLTSKGIGYLIQFKFSRAGQCIPCRRK